MRILFWGRLLAGTCRPVERTPHWSKFPGRTCDHVMDPFWNRLCQKDGTPWKTDPSWSSSWKRYSLGRRKDWQEGVNKIYFISHNHALFFLLLINLIKIPKQSLLFPLRYSVRDLYQSLFQLMSLSLYFLSPIQLQKGNDKNSFDGYPASRQGQPTTTDSEKYSDVGWYRCGQ